MQLLICTAWRLLSIDVGSPPIQDVVTSVTRPAQDRRSSPILGCLSCVANWVTRKPQLPHHPAVWKGRDWGSTSVPMPLRTRRTDDKNSELTSRVGWQNPGRGQALRTNGDENRMMKQGGMGGKEGNQRSDRIHLPFWLFGPKYCCNK